MAPKKGNKKSGKPQQKAPAAPAQPAAKAPQESQPEAPKKPTKAVVGINFGETFSSIALINKEGLADTIANDDGERQVATAISFLGGQQYVGNPARQQLVRNQKNVIVGFRSLLGRPYADVANIPRPHGSAAIVDVDGQPGFSVVIDEDGEPVPLTAADIAQRFLTTLIGYAQDFYGRPVTHAVVAIPATFSSAQQAAVKAAVAASSVPEENISLISDTSAAILGYTEEPYKASPANQLVVDIGATTSKASVVEQRGGIAVPIAEETTTGDAGDALDATLISFFSKEFAKKTKVNIDPKDHRANVKLVLASDVVKRSLSASTTAQCSIESLAEGLDFNSPINRMRLAVVASKVLDNVAALVESVLEKAQIHPVAIDEVAFVGATTKLEFITSRILQIINEDARILPGAAENVISLGAARQADLLYGSVASETPLHDKALAAVQPILSDASAVDTLPAVSATVGFTLPVQDGLVSVHGNEDLSFFPLIGKDTPVPAQASITFPATKGSSVINLYEATDKVITTEPEPAPKEEGDEEDDDDDFPEDPIHTRYALLGNQLATFALPEGSTGLILDVSSDKATLRAVGGTPAELSF